MIKVPHNMNQLLLGRQTDVIEYPKQETYDATGTALEASEPATAQVSYTLTAADFPTINGVIDDAVLRNITFYLIGGGKNTTAGALTVSYRLLKNGVSLVTSTKSVAANYYYTINCKGMVGCVVGDVLELRLWGNAALDYRYKAIISAPMIYVPMGKVGRLMTDLDFVFPTAWPVPLTAGLSPAAQITDTVFLTTTNTSDIGTYQMALSSLSGAAYHLDFIGSKSSYGLLRTATVQTPTIVASTQASFFPYYVAPPRLFGTFSYTPTTIFY